MLIDWPANFDRMLTDLERRADAGDRDAGEVLDLVLAQLAYLQDLVSAPTEDTATLKKVQQSRRHLVWRLSHPYRPNHAVRTIVWFPDSHHVVVALFANDKAQMGDVFYNSVGSRADQIVDQWRRDREDTT